MTAYNSEKYIELSIKSILKQTYKNFELIIVNDFSSDSTLEILKKIKDKRLKIFNLKKRFGRTNALNFGLKKCKSNIIAIQDSDDISLENRLQLSIKELEKDKELGLVGTSCSFINSKGKKINILNKINSINQKIKSIKFFNSIPHSSIIFKKNKLKSLSYNVSYIYAQDYELILRFIRYSKIKIIDKKVLKVRLHKNNMSNNFKYKKFRIKEDLRLLTYSLKYLKPNFFEMKNIFYLKFKNYIKLIILYL